MIDKEIERIERSAGKTRRWCSVLRVITALFLAFSLLAYGISTMFFLVSGTMPIPKVLLHLSEGVLAITVLAVLTIILNDAVKRRTPFSGNQATLFSVLGALFLAYAVICALAPDAVVSVPSGTVAAASDLSTEEAPIRINLIYIVMGLTMLSISATHRYGALLQKLSDDTV